MRTLTQQQLMKKAESAVQRGQFGTQGAEILQSYSHNDLSSFPPIYFSKIIYYIYIFKITLL